MEDYLTFAQTYAAQRLVVKFQKVFEVPGKSYGPVVECFQSESETTINVEVERCRFGTQEIDTGERVIATLGSPSKFQIRLRHLRGRSPPDWQTAMDVLKAT